MLDDLPGTEEDVIVPPETEIATPYDGKLNEEEKRARLQALRYKARSRIWIQEKTGFSYGNRLSTPGNPQHYASGRFLQWQAGYENYFDNIGWLGLGIGSLMLQSGTSDVTDSGLSVVYRHLFASYGLPLASPSWQAGGSLGLGWGLYQYVDRDQPGDPLRTISIFQSGSPSLGLYAEYVYAHWGLSFNWDLYVPIPDRQTSLSPYQGYGLGLRYLF